jgi:N-acetylglucosamine repressor
MKTSNIGNSELIAQVNRRLVLQAVRRFQPTFRAAVSRSTNLNPATVTGIVKDLLRAGFIKEVGGDAKSLGPGGGRPPMMLELNNSARQILAVDLEPDILRVALVGLSINIVDYREEIIDRHNRPETVIRKLFALCDEVLRRGRRRRLDGIGVSLPGLIDREKGILISSTNLPHWRDVPIRDLFAKRFKLEPKVERSVHMAAMYEDWVEPTGQSGTKLVLSLRTGIGMSVIHQGALYLGVGGFEGEIGHTVIDLNGKLCECGNRGCLETFVSADAIRERIEKMIVRGRCRAVTSAISAGERLRPELVYRLAKQGDVDCVEIVRDVGQYVGLAAANMVNLFAPDTLILCGSIDNAEELILEVIRQEVELRSLPQLRHGLTIRLARGKEKSSLLGAAVMVARNVFDLPRLTPLAPTLTALQACT